MRQDFQKFEQKRKMNYLTNAERTGYERGYQKGWVESLILRQLTKLLGEVSKQNCTAIESLTIEKLEALAPALLDFTSTDDLLGWLQQNQNA